MMTFKKIINDLGGPAAFYKDMSVPAGLVHYWINADSIPAPYWAKLVRIARRKNVKGITAATLVNLVAKPE